ncbi:MAG: response regulator [bacterium]|nr:response regulator [bacterium]
MATILVAEDEAKMRKILALSLMEEGHEILEAKDAEEAAHVIRTTSISLVISDLRMPGGGGMSVLKAVQEVNHYIPVIILTAYGTIENAVEALKNGAADYLLKPCDLDEIKLAVHKALQVQQLELENIYLRNEISDLFGDVEIVGRSESIQNVLDMVKRIAQGDGVVMIRGESGTGKELVARAIHQQSPRAGKAFVTVKCAGSPADLLELELFGRVRNLRGASSAPAAGKFELAHGGTLFLDEVGELPPRIQGKILKTIEEGSIEPVGGDRPKKVDVRLIASTRMDMEEKVSQETFRSELYYRMNVLPLILPPLRERREDIPLLVDHFLRRKSPGGKPAIAFSDEDLDAMMRYHWPGNVRELENVVERAVVLGATGVNVLLPAAHIPETDGGGMNFEEKELLSLSYKEAKHLVLEKFEKTYFTHLLQKTRGNVSRAARIAQVHRKNLHVKISELDIDPHQYSQNGGDRS